jgi:hypothetical protein
VAEVTARVIRFPTQTVVICKAHEGDWLVLGERGHGWLHGDYHAAVEDAVWLSKNLKLLIREVI